MGVIACRARGAPGSSPLPCGSASGCCFAGPRGRPEACDQCHPAPDHPQIEIYEESKHGTICHAEGARWAWRPENRAWQAGADYRAPTCAACHMSAAG